MAVKTGHVLIGAAIAQTLFCGIAAYASVWAPVHSLGSKNQRSLDTFSVVAMMTSCYGWIGLMFLVVTVSLTRDGLRRSRRGSDAQPSDSEAGSPKEQ